MAGHHLTKDPAIERWADFRNQQYRSFKFTRRNAFWSVVFCIAIPYGMIYLAYYTRGGYVNMRGALREQPVFRDDLLRMQNNKDTKEE